jgi:hypothetical protein
LVTSAEKSAGWTTGWYERPGPKTGSGHDDAVLAWAMFGTATAAAAQAAAVAIRRNLFIRFSS